MKPEIEVTDILPQVATQISAFYNSLIIAGVPEDLARELTVMTHRAFLEGLKAPVVFVKAPPDNIALRDYAAMRVFA